MLASLSMSYLDFAESANEELDRREKLAKVPCRYKMDCTETSCPYRHPRGYDWHTAYMNTPHKPCKHEGKCTQKECPYYHPSGWTYDWKQRSTECRFGSRCKNSSCIYLHTERERIQKGREDGSLQQCLTCKKYVRTDYFRRMRKDGSIQEQFSNCWQCRDYTDRSSTRNHTRSSFGTKHSHGATSWGYRDFTAEHARVSGYEL